MLNSYGWSRTLQQQFQAYAAHGLAPARVIVQQRGLYVLATPTGGATARLSGRFANEAEAGGYPVTGEGLERLGESFAPGQTAALLGSSGVGKSSLVNALAGAPLMATRAIREHAARGRHATTHRQLVLLPGGRLILDTPGMRELGLWEADAGVARTFADVEALARYCRLRDCAHEAEPGCAVRTSIAEGRLDGGRWRRASSNWWAAFFS